MNHHKSYRRILAMALSVVMVLGMVPITAAAEELPAGTSGEITAFEKLANATATQTVALGTPFEDLDLPETLNATVRLKTDTSEPVQDSGNVVQQEPAQNTESVQQEQVSEGEVSPEHEEVPAADQENPDNGYTEMTVPMPVTWTGSPDYDGNTPGVYVFTAEISGFTVSAELPVITVTVGQAAVKGTITAFDELTEDIRWQNTTKAELPSELTGTVEGENIQIPVSWEADHDYDSDSPATGLYVFTAKPGDGYALAQAVELPRITVYIPAVKKRMMLRMAGSGTSTSPLEITTAAQLEEIAVLVNEGRLESFLLGDSAATVSLKLMNDLDLSAYGEGWNGGKGWVPIGTDTNPFKANFDGNGKKITGLYINSTEEYIGLFGYIKGGTAQNLDLEKVSISGSNNVSGVAGRADGSVTSCNVSGSVSGTVNVGGVAGKVEGSVTRCYATGAVTATGGYVGGVAGVIVAGEVTSCAALNPSVSGNSSVGRVAGDFYNEGTLSGNAAFSGMTVTVNGALQATSGGEADNMNGADMSIATIQTDGTVGGCFADTIIWTVENGKLPILTNAGGPQTGDLPPHLANDTIAPYFIGAGIETDPYQMIYFGA